MKYVIMLTILMALSLIPSTAHAGSSNCTGSTSVTAPGNYTAPSSDCIVSVDKSYFEPTLAYIPSNPSIGDEFTVRENTTAQECDSWQDPDTLEVFSYCYPAGVEVETVGASIPIDGSNAIFMGDFHQQVRLIYNGYQWDATYSYF